MQRPPGVMYTNVCVSNGARWRHLVRFAGARPRRGNTRVHVRLQTSMLIAIFRNVSVGHARGRAACTAAARPQFRIQRCVQRHRAKAKT